MTVAAAAAAAAVDEEVKDMDEDEAAEAGDDGAGESNREDENPEGTGAKRRRMVSLLCSSDDIPMVDERDSGDGSANNEGKDAIEMRRTVTGRRVCWAAACNCARSSTACCTHEGNNTLGCNEYR